MSYKCPCGLWKEKDSSVCFACSANEPCIKKPPIMTNDPNIRNLAGTALQKRLESHMASFVKAHSELLREVNEKRYDQWKDGLIGNDELVIEAIKELLHGTSKIG